MKKYILGLLTIIFGTIGFSQALILEFINLNLHELMENFSGAEFVAPGNHFAGAFFWLPPKSMGVGQTIELNGEEEHCFNLVRGLYYNSQRGERLRPIDPYTLTWMRAANSSYDNLDISGGLFGTCENNPYGIFGQVTFERSGTTTYLMAGIETVYEDNWMTGNFKNNLQYFNNDLPLGYIVDNVGGIGFIGGNLTGHDCLNCLLNGDCSNYPLCNTQECTGDSINDFFEYSGTQVIAASGCDFTITGVNITGGPQRGISIQGKIGLGPTLNTFQRQSLLGNQKKSIILNTPNATSADLINKTKKTAQQLCRGSKTYNSSTLPSTDEDVICFNFPNYNGGNNNITIDLTDENKYQGKTIIVQNANIILENSIENIEHYIDLFVDKGNIILKNNLGNLQRFDGNGYLANTPAEMITQGFFLQGNFIINGLLLAKNGSLGSFNHKFYFHGKLHTLNTPIAPSNRRKTQINKLFATNIFADRINLQKTFDRYCNPVTGSGSDGVPCFNDPLAGSPIVIIDKTFPSKLFTK